MKTKSNLFENQSIPALRRGRRAACLAAMALSATSLHAVTTNIWTGGGADNHWSTAANWGGTAPVSGSGNWMVFGNTNWLTSSNDLAGFVASTSTQNWINFSNAVWNIAGNQVNPATEDTLALLAGKAQITAVPLKSVMVAFATALRQRCGAVAAAVLDRNDLARVVAPKDQRNASDRACEHSVITDLMAPRGDVPGVLKEGCGG